MRIPNFINLNTLTTYKPSNVTIRLKSEQNRQVLSEWFTWDDEFVPTLANLCIHVIAKYFEKYPIWNLLLPCDQYKLLECLSTDIDLHVIVPIVQDELYWKRRYDSHFGSRLFKKHIGWTWKCVYLEQYISKACEEAEPQYKDEEFQTIQKLLTLTSGYIHILYITELREWNPPKTMLIKDRPCIYPDIHINFIPILKKLIYIQELQISYDKENVGEGYNRRMMNVDPKDCELLGAALADLKHLKILKLHRSNITDIHLKYFLQKLLQNNSLVELDLSYNNIGDFGAQYLSEFLNKHEKLKVLNLKGNKVGEAGIHGLAWSILTPEGTFLRHLDLSLNPLEHNGMLNLCKALIRGHYLEELSVAACGINGQSAFIFGNVIRINTSLKKLDISNNDFGERGGQSLLESLESNTNLIKLSMEYTNIPKMISNKIKEFVNRNNKMASLRNKSSNSLDFRHNLSRCCIPHEESILNDSTLYQL